MPNVKIPDAAVGGDDIQPPVDALLKDLLLLGGETDGKGFTAAFAGPPQSVAVIEAGLTAGTKWWTAGGGAVIAAIWAKLYLWWGNQPNPVKVTALGGAFFATGMLALAAGYLLGSDVRGRGQAATATIDARAQIARAMIRAAASHASAAPTRAAAPGGGQPNPPDGPSQVVGVTPGIPVGNVTVPAEDEADWKVIGLIHAPAGILYVVVKGQREHILPADKLRF